MLHDGSLEATFNAASTRASALAVLGCHGVTEAARVVLGHDNHGWLHDLLWAWLSICNGSMSSAHKLRVVADGEQLHFCGRVYPASMENILLWWISLSKSSKNQTPLIHGRPYPIQTKHTLGFAEDATFGCMRWSLTTYHGASRIG